MILLTGADAVQRCLCVFAVLFIQKRIIKAKFVSDPASFLQPCICHKGPSINC